VSTQFPPAVRLRVRREFTAVQEHGRRVATKFMTLLAQPNGRDRDRLGIIASRRLGDAVVRNRAKRRLREVFRRHQADQTRALDIVAIPRRELLTAPFDMIDNDFCAAVRRLRGGR
jgi:ribonuclease P protein component